MLLLIFKNSPIYCLTSHFLHVMQTDDLSWEPAIGSEEATLSPGFLAVDLLTLRVPYDLRVRVLYDLCVKIVLFLFTFLVSGK